MVDPQLRIIDLFCGIGSMHIAAEELGMKCVYACDNDPHVRKAYQAHFGVLPDGDIRDVDAQTVPDHDILCAGFPCQPFSRMGNKKGTNEERGRVVDYAIDILRTKRPRAFVLENVRGLLNSNNGEDFKRLKEMVAAAGYSFQHQLLKCEDFGIPQTRHRVFMVGFRDGYPEGFAYPIGQGVCPTLATFLGVDVVKTLSNTVRCSGRRSGVDNTKNWSAYRLKDGSVFEYELEHATKLQGFPLDFDWGGAPDSQRWKMLGNTIPTCLSKAILAAVGAHLKSRPERPAAPLPIVPHPPPARTIIEKHLQDCEQKTMEKKQRKVKDKEEEEGNDDDDEEEEEEKEMPEEKSRRKHHKRAREQEDDDDEMKEKRKRAPKNKIEEKREEPSGKNPPSEHRRLRPVIIIRSGTSISLTLPEGVDEQLYDLRIIK